MFWKEIKNNKIVAIGESVALCENQIEITEEEFNSVIFETQTIITAEQIDAQVVERIRLQYNENDEIKMLRLGIVDSINAEFLTYNIYVEECREWGRVEKLELGV